MTGTKRATEAKRLRRPITASRLGMLDASLVPRDRDLVDALGLVQVATTAQLARICFGDAASDTALRLARRSLQRLREVGLVRRFEDRAFERRAGAPGYVHALTNAGLKLARTEHGVGVRHRAWQPSYRFLSHALGISEVFARLIEAERAGGPQVREFAAEGAAARRYLAPSGESRIIRPDALVRVAARGIEVSNFVEVDRGSETSPATIAAKCEAYRNYELSGEEVRRHGVFPGVLFIVPDGARARAIAQTIARLDPDARELFAVSLEADAASVLGRVESPTVPDRAPPLPSHPVVG